MLEQNDILVYVNIKRVFFDSFIKSTVYLLIFRQNLMILEGSPNSLTEPYFTIELGMGESIFVTPVPHVHVV